MDGWLLIELSLFAGFLSLTLFLLELVWRTIKQQVEGRKWGRSRRQPGMWDWPSPPDLGESGSSYPGAPNDVLHRRAGTKLSPLIPPTRSRSRFGRIQRVGGVKGGARR